MKKVLLLLVVSQSAFATSYNCTVDSSFTSSLNRDIQLVGTSTAPSLVDAIRLLDQKLCSRKWYYADLKNCIEQVDLMAICTQNAI